MSLPLELLDTAKFLLKRERTKPKQATLRRAVSTAYYAFFHLLIEESTKAFLGAQGTQKKLRTTFGRVFEHTEMKDAAKQFASPSLPDVWKNVLGNQPVAQSLKVVAETFIAVQTERHRADYNLQLNFSKREAQKIIDDIERAFRLWQQCKTTPEARVFLLALFTKKRLDGRK
jgi:uncharacterized protein (UPF0332 family)